MWACARVRACVRVCVCVCVCVSACPCVCQSAHPFHCATERKTSGADLRLLRRPLQSLAEENFSDVGGGVGGSAGASQGPKQPPLPPRSLSNGLHWTCFLSGVHLMSIEHSSMIAARISRPRGVHGRASVCIRIFSAGVG